MASASKQIRLLLI